MPKKKDDNHRNILKTEDNNFLDDKRCQYLKEIMSGGSGWDFARKAMIEVVEEYAEIIGSNSMPEHKKIVKFLLGKTK